MAELKTKPTSASVTDFLGAVEDEERRKDCFGVVKIMQKATGAKPKMWGPSIVGFGDYRYANQNVLCTLVEESVEHLRARK